MPSFHRAVCLGVVGCSPPPLDPKAAEDSVEDSGLELSALVRHQGVGQTEASNPSLNESAGARLGGDVAHGDGLGPLGEPVDHGEHEAAAAGGLWKRPDQVEVQHLEPIRRLKSDRFAGVRTVHLHLLAEDAAGNELPGIAGGSRPVVMPGQVCQGATDAWVP